MGGDTIFCAARYGNVMASRGSIPLFVSQIIRSEPITITDANMTRFLMSLEDSVDLVLQAFNEGKRRYFCSKSSSRHGWCCCEALKTIFNSSVETRIIVQGMVRSYLKHWYHAKRWPWQRNSANIIEYPVMIAI